MFHRNSEHGDFLIEKRPYRREEKAGFLLPPFSRPIIAVHSVLVLKHASSRALSARSCDKE